jgi:hypothetical protein
MTYFEYAAIYIGIIVGLALSNILMSIHKLVEASARVRWHWMAPATAVYAATVTLGSFWSLFVRRGNVDHHTFLTSLPTAIALGLLFLTCAASLPDDVPEQGIDLKAYYFDNRKRFWGFSTGTHVLNLLTWLFALVELGFHGKTLAQSLYPMVGNSMEAAVSLSLVFARAPWWHAVGIASLWIFSLFYFGPMLLN